MAEFCMPSLGADMSEGTLLEWLVHPGDVVHHGDVVAVVDTAKSAIDVEVFTDGRVEALLVEPGTTVPVGTPLATIGDLTEAGPRVEPPGVSPVLRHLAHELGVDLTTVTGSGPSGAVTRADVERAAVHETTAPTTEPAVSPSPVPEPAVAAVPAEPSQPAAVPAARVPAAARGRVSPYARRRAAQLGVDVAGLHGSGPGGAVTVADVEAAALAPKARRRKARPASAAHAQAPTVSPEVTTPAGRAAEPAGTPAERSAAMRAAIGALMARSKREIPHYYLQSTLDVTPAVTWLEERNTGRPSTERILPAALLLKASAVAVRAVPEVNGFYVDGAFRRSEHVHLGVAVSLRGGGLVAPAIHDADQMGIEELMDALKDLVARARAGRLRGSEMADPTLTVTNLGDQGAELVHGVIYPPQVALVGFGRIVERPWAVEGMLTVRPVVTVTLAADHRVTDGHRGGLYLAAVAEALTHPEAL